MYEIRKIVPYGEGFMSLKQNGSEDTYHKRGRVLNDVRSLLNYIQNDRVKFKFDLSNVNGGLKKKLEVIIAGTKTVREEDWAKI